MVLCFGICCVFVSYLLSNNQPHTVLFRDETEDEDTTGQYFISIEQKIMMECSNAVTSLFNLVVSHYVFNLAYHQDMLIFIQEKILGIESDSKKKNMNPLSSSYVSGIVQVKLNLGLLTSSCVLLLFSVAISSNCYLGITLL